MSKLTLHALTKSYGGRDIFKDFNLEIVGGTRLAVVGANGAGKSTLLRILAGESHPDSGRVIFSTGARLGYVAQELDAGDLERQRGAIDDDELQDKNIVMLGWYDPGYIHRRTRWEPPEGR